MAVDHFRRKAKSPVEPLSDEIAAGIAAPDEMAEVTGKLAELKPALMDLTDEQRQVILLKFIGGLSNAEVSQVLKKPESAVKSLQHRALASLRRILREDKEEEGK